MGVCLVELCGNDEAMKTEASKLMGKVPELRQRIAGKSIPLEVRSHFLKTQISYIVPEICGQKGTQIPDARQSACSSWAGVGLYFPWNRSSTTIGYS
jgi:hypothetical protein